MATTETKHLKCSPTFPIACGEQWLVRGVGGEPSERWTVVMVYTDKNGPHAFDARVEQLPVAA